MNAPAPNTDHTTNTQAGVPPVPPEAHQQAGEGDESGEAAGPEVARAHAGLTATYSPDDNKLRLYSLHRLAPEVFERVKATGFRWAPKQDLFVAPMWTPARADLLIELCGEIGDEDTSLVDRAAERADRFEGYSERRGDEAQAARRAVSAIADHIPAGQPILVGHHSERRARKDCERIRTGMRRAVKLWETSGYWTQRAEGAIRAAKYKELPGVRHRRIKTIEADKRSSQRAVEQAQLFLSVWQREGLTLDQAKTIANRDHVSQCFPLAQYPREVPASQYEGAMSLWSALEDGVISVDQAREIAVRAHTRMVAHQQRWLEHFDFRLGYERAMLGEQLGTTGKAFDLQPGGRVLAGGVWSTIVRVNRQGGTVVSVSTNRRGRVVGAGLITEYAAPTAEEAATVKAVTKLPPLTNFPGEGVVEITRAQWNEVSKDYRTTERREATATTGAHRVRVALGCFVLPKGSDRGHAYVTVFITDAKRVDPPAPAEVSRPTLPAPVRVDPVAAPAPARPAEPTEFDTMREQLRQGVQVVAVPQLFPTPAELAARMVAIAGLASGSRVLEPSAGTGVLVRAIRERAGSLVTAVEIDARMVALLRAREPGAEIVQATFWRARSSSSAVSIAC
jgi:hypothetical protein